MIHVKVQYDAYNRTFKLVDSAVGPLLDDYAVYDLAIPFSLGEAQGQDSLLIIETAMAHA